MPAPATATIFARRRPGSLGSRRPFASVVTPVPGCKDSVVDRPTAIPLSPEDRAILDLESPSIAGHTCKVVRIGPGAPAVDELRTMIAARIAAAPELTRMLGGDDETPAWVPDPGFDLARHVRPSALDPAADRAAELEEVARLFERRLDRDRPLWAIDAIPRSGGGSLLVWRIHHALADGTAAMRFAEAILWDAGPGPAAPARGEGSSRSGEHPDEARRRAHLAAFVERELAASRHRSPFDGTVGARRRIAVAELALARVHDAARELASATLNDAVLAVVAGSLRRWIERCHGRLDDVRVRVPVSLHHEGDATANRDSFFSARLPLTIADPIERLRTIKRETTARKRAHDGERIESVLATLGRRSSRLATLVERIEASPREFAVSVSNVPGPRRPVSVLGAPVEQLYTIAEIGLRHALRVSAVSLADRLFLAFNTDADLIDGVEVMAAGAEVEAAELIDLAA